MQTNPCIGDQPYLEEVQPDGDILAKEARSLDVFHSS